MSTKIRSTLNRRHLLALAGASTGMLAMPGILRAQNNNVVLSALIALTGPNSAWGQRTWRGFQLACDIVNERGGIQSLGGAKIKYIVADTESKPELAPTQAERLIREGAVAMIGTNQSPASIVATQVTERAGVPFVSSTDADPLLTGRGFKNVFRTMATVDRYVDDLLASIRAAADAAGDKPTKLAILSENSITGQSSVKFAQELAPKYGFEVVEAANYDATRTQNFTPYIAKYKGQGVEVLIGHNRPNDAILITRSMNELSYAPKAYGGIIGGHVSAEYISTLGTAAENVLIAGAWSPDLTIDGLSEIAERYQKQYNESVDSTVAGGVISLAVLWAGLEAAGAAESAKLRDAIAGLDMAPGQNLLIQPGGVKFDERGENAKATGIVLQIRDGKQVTVYPDAVAATKMVYPKPA